MIWLTVELLEMYMKLIYTFEIISHSKYGEHISLLILT